MGLFKRRSSDAPDGYHLAKEGERYITLNGVKYAQDSAANGDGSYDYDPGQQDYENKFSNTASRNKDAADSLKDSENSATSQSGADNKQGALSAQRSSETDVKSDRADAGSSSFKNNVQGAGAKIKGRSKSFVRRFGPILASSCGIAGFGVMSFFGQMSMPISLISQIQGSFDSMGTSNIARTNNMMRWQMDTENRLVKDCVKSRIFGADKFKLTSRQRAKLAKNGITVDDSGKYTVLKYGDKTIVPDSRLATGDNEIEFKQFYEQDAKFREAYSNSSRTWRGAVANWFDGITNKFLKKLGVYRGVWSDFKKARASGDAADMDNIRTKIADEAAGGSAKGAAEAGSYDKSEYDDDGTTKTKYDEGTSRTDMELKTDDIDVDSTGKIDLDAEGGNSKLSSKLKSFAEGAAGKVTDIAGAAVSITCGLLNAVGAINMIVVAYQTAQILKVASAIFEGIQKGQVESSTISPINELGNSLTLPATNTYQYYEKNDTDHAVEVTRTRSAMEAESVGAIYENRRTNYRDPSIQSFNLSNSLGVIASALNLGSASFKGCTYAKLAASVIGAVKDGVDIVLCIVSFGIGCAVDFLIDSVGTIAAGVALSTAIGLLVKLVLPIVAKILTRKIATDVMGEDLGNALISGGNMYMGQNHQVSGGAVADKNGLTSFIALSNEVEADRARVARTSLSPFDINSKYTFMGSLVAKFRPIVSRTGTVMSSVSSIGNIFSSAVSSLMPGANAVSAAITAQEAADDTEEHCNELSSIGAVGDAFCNPYFITDVKTLDTDPAQIVNEVDALADNFEDGEGDVPVISKGSRLAKYIVYCGQRESPFGMADQNIASSVQTGNVGIDMVDAAIGAIPIVGDALQAVQESEVLANYGYVSGEACVTGNKKDGMDSVATYADWEENQKYQRFIEDQRLSESMGLVEESALTAFLNEYYEEHPLDESYEGILARRSGLTKGQVAVTLDTMEFLAWYAEYDPVNLAYAPYVPEEEPETRFIFEEGLDNNSIAMATLQNPFLEERRQRSFAV